MRDSLTIMPGKCVQGAMLISVLLAGGCASNRHCPPPQQVPEKPAGYPCGPCAGYFPTCWRPWPDVCPSCPVFGLEEATPTEMPMETVPTPPTNGDATMPDAAPEMEIPPADAEPALPDQANPEEPPPGNDQASAPPIRLGPPTSRRVVNQLPEWQMPPLPEGRRSDKSQRMLEAQSEERPVRTPRVVPASHQGEPIIKRVNR